MVARRPHRRRVLSAHVERTGVDATDPYRRPRDTGPVPARMSWRARSARGTDETSRRDQQRPARAPCLPSPAHQPGVGAGHPRPVAAASTVPPGVVRDAVRSLRPPPRSGATGGHVCAVSSPQLRGPWTTTARSSRTCSLGTGISSSANRPTVPSVCAQDVAVEVTMRHGRTARSACGARSSGANVGPANVSGAGRRAASAGQEWRFVGPSRQLLAFRTKSLRDPGGRGNDVAGLQGFFVNSEPICTGLTIILEVTATEPASARRASSAPCR